MKSSVEQDPNLLLIDIALAEGRSVRHIADTFSLAPSTLYTYFKSPAYLLKKRKGFYLIASEYIEKMVQDTESKVRAATRKELAKNPRYNSPKSKRSDPPPQAQPINGNKKNRTAREELDELITEAKDILATTKKTKNVASLTTILKEIRNQLQLQAQLDGDLNTGINIHIQKNEINMIRMEILDTVKKYPEIHSELVEKLQAIEAAPPPPV